MNSINKIMGGFISKFQSHFHSYSRKNKHKKQKRKANKKR